MTPEGVKGEPIMDVAETRQGETLVLGLNGRMDSNTAPVFEKHILGRIEGGDTDLVVDFADVDFVSSAGLRVMLMAAKRIKAAKGRMIVCGLNEGITKVFEVSGFMAIFTVHPTREDAFSAL